jgi:rSAM/selenodomain-associated transferase 2
MSISVIVPTLNEAELIQPLIDNLLERAQAAEIIVADGGSTDRTAELAGLAQRVVRSKRGRAAQMNAGAQAARGEILWFLHADVKVPPECVPEIDRIMSNPCVVGGFFRIRLPHSHPIYRLTDSFAHYAGLFLRMRCGDHGIFCRRKIFMELGGFPEVPLMEDVEFFRRLRRCGRVIHSDKRIVISARRYETIGRARLTLAYGFIATLYSLGVPLSVLAQIYQRTCCRAREARSAS